MNTLTVTEINRIIKYKIKEIPQFANVFVIGEITNFNERSRFGHWYFSLKDDNSQLSCNMFMNYQRGVKFQPENGMKVICSGYIDVYEKGGSYQLYVMSMNTLGAGEDMLALEELKKKLTAEGLFDSSHKKPIPEFPQKIGIVTSPTGAAVEDLKTNILRRWDMSEIIISPALVQGEKAPASIVKAILRLDAIDGVDVIIVGRGGGANEDLKAFNTEIVARAVFNCNSPIISAVGHEVDFTLCDAAADLSVSTPTAAALRAVPDKYEQQRIVDDAFSALISALAIKIERAENNLQKLSITANRSKFYEKLENEIENYSEVIDRRVKELVNVRENDICRLAEKLDVLSPLSVLGRGYSIARHNGKVLNSARSVDINDGVTVIFKDGSIEATVNGVKYNEE